MKQGRRARLLWLAAPAAPAFQEVSLQEVERVNIRIAQADGLRQHVLTRQQRRRVGDVQNAAHAAVILLFDEAENSLAESDRPHQRGIKTGDIEVRLGQGVFSVVDEVEEERPAFVHATQKVEAMWRVVALEFLQGMAEAKPRGKQVP